MDFLETLKTRRSVRKYSDKQVDEATLSAILEAGTYAATGRNRQSPVIIAVQDKEAREQLRRMNAAVMGTEGDPFYGAPTVVIVLADRGVHTCVEDGALVIGNMMNAAHALGVDSCWIHRAREEFESDEGRTLLAKWGVEGDLVGVGHLILGYGEGEKPVAAPRKQNYVYRV
jgi:nitroreductase